MSRIKKHIFQSFLLFFIICLVNFYDEIELYCAIAVVCLEFRTKLRLTKTSKMTSQKDSSDTESTSHENDECLAESVDSVGSDGGQKVTGVESDVTFHGNGAVNEEWLNEECANQWSKTFRKGTFVLAHILLLLIPILLCYVSDTQRTQRSKDLAKRNSLLNDLEKLIMKVHFNRSNFETVEGNVTLINSTLPTALLAPALVRWRLYSLWMFPFLALPDISQNIWIFNADIHRKKRFDISVLMLLVMSSLPIMSLILASSTHPGLLCGSLLDSDGLNLNLSIDVQKYAIFVSALIVVYRLLTRSRLMSRQVELSRIILHYVFVKGTFVHDTVVYWQCRRHERISHCFLPQRLKPIRFMRRGLKPI